MRAFDLRPGRLVLAVVFAALAGALFASGAGAANTRIKVKHVWLAAPVAPGTPNSFSAPGSGLRQNQNLNQVGVIKVGSPKAKNVMVFEPGTSAGGPYIVPFAKSVTEHLPGWQ